MTNILFVCRYNRFRSRTAAAYFKKIAPSGIEIKSCGAIRGNPVSELQKKSAARFDINISGEPQGISSELLKWQDITVIVADDVPEELFSSNGEHGKKTIVWAIKDAKEEDMEADAKIIQEIIDRCDEFVRKFR